MLIQTKDLTLTYMDGNKEINAVKNVNIEFAETGLFGILGPSGSGKTSLLYLLAGLRTPTSGEIFFNGDPLPIEKEKRNLIRRTQMGFVFQSNFLIDYLNVFENILLGAEITYPASRLIIQELLHELNLQDLAHRTIDKLSGGQKQRVTIARALANRPKVVFVDEPTSSLDHVNGKKVVALLEKIAQRACVIIVTHDETNIASADRVYSIWDGEVRSLGGKKRK